MKPVPLQALAEAAGAGVVLPEAREEEARIVRRVSTDSRHVEPGDLFVALRGARFDGHSYVTEAADRGATACLVDQTFPAASRKKMRIPSLVVDDTVEGLGCMARWYRREVLGDMTCVVAITGSNGKTTTKQMLDHVLAGALTGSGSPKSFNNHIGVPLTILSADAEDDYLIVEIGTSAPGEVSALAEIAEPNMGIITCIGAAHLEGLIDEAGVLREKLSLLDHLRADGVAIVNGDQDEIRAGLADRIHLVSRRSGRAASRTSLASMCIMVKHSGGLSRHARLVTVGKRSDVDRRVSFVSGSIRESVFQLADGVCVAVTLPGEHHAVNVAAVWAAAREFGLSSEMVAARLATFVPGEGRALALDIQGVAVVDDSYNANPGSMLAAIETLRRHGKGRRVFVMGDMLELGSTTARWHERAVRAAMDAELETLVAVGPRVSAAVAGVDRSASSTELIAVDDVSQAIDVVPTLVRAGDTVWVKGSRAMHLDRLVARWRGDQQKKTAVA